MSAILAPLAPIWRYRSRMPSVQVKNVPPEVHAELQRRARRKGISLQDYLLGLLTEETSHLPLDEIFDRIERGEGGRTGGRLSLEDAAAVIREERDARS